MIRDLAPDQKITEPGFYRMSLDRHHGQPCDGPSVTSGVLRKMELETPADVWAFHQLNPDRWPSEDKPALRMGRAMAAFIEGGEEAVLKEFLLLPADKPRRPTPQQIQAYVRNESTETGKASVEFWNAVDADPRDEITQADFDLIVTMGRVLAADPAASAVMGGEPEITMAVQDDETGLWLLSRPDNVAFDGTLADYKKVNTQGRPFNYRVVDNRITQHAYSMQMAFAAHVYERLTGEWPTSVGLVFQWDQPPHHVILREIAEEDLKMDQFRNRRAIRNFAHCLKTGHWWGPGEDVGVYQRPTWQRDQILSEMQQAGVAP